jgi:hypothetical protein
MFGTVLKFTAGVAAMYFGYHWGFNAGSKVVSVGVDLVGGDSVGPRHLKHFLIREEV